MAIAPAKPINVLLRTLDGEPRGLAVPERALPCGFIGTRKAHMGTDLMQDLGHASHWPTLCSTWPRQLTQHDLFHIMNYRSIIWNACEAPAIRDAKKRGWEEQI
jgi:hypothetical protein